MDQSLKETLWHQFGAAIDMLSNAIEACPDELWDTSSQFWYTSYHTLFYLDYYLSGNTENFSPPEPFTLSELDPAGVLPDRTYTKEELLTYAKFGKQKCHDVITGLTAENANRRFINEYRNYSIIEILLYNMRHVQHHAAQLNQLLRQLGHNPPGWVSQTKDAL